MSTKIAKSVTQKLSEKFEKDLEKFFVWAVKNEYLIKNDDSEIEWSMELLKTIEFTEPGRNKLDSFINAVKDSYTIENEDGEVDDAKLMAKEFKDAKEKSPRKKKAEKEIEQNETGEVKPKKVKKTKTIEEVEDVVVPKKVKKTKTVIVEAEIESVKLDMTLDTENTDWLDIIEFWTNDLIKVFGKPHKTGGKEDNNHTHEWKLEINGGIYSIYDWDNTDAFEDITWHIATHVESKSENKENIKTLYNYMNSMLPEEDTKLDFENLDCSESEDENESENESESESEE